MVECIYSLLTVCNQIFPLVLPYSFQASLEKHSQRLGILGDRNNVMTDKGSFGGTLSKVSWLPDLGEHCKDCQFSDETNRGICR